MQRMEIAKELQCNLRNISEYRKVLESVGYEITSTRGKDGGYALKKPAILPARELHDEQLKALKEASVYLHSHPDFLPYQAFKDAVDKVLISTHIHSEDSGVYLSEQRTFSKQIRLFISKCEKARNEQRVVELEYKRLNAKMFHTVLIHPYEILNDHGNYYCLAYSLKAKDYRIFRFSEERMRSVHIIRAHFQRDPLFKLEQHIGQLSLIKDQTYTLEMRLYDTSARLFKEKPQGIVKEMQWINEATLHVEVLMEGRSQILRFLLAQGMECEVIKPQEFRDELEKITKHMLRTYETKA